MEKITGTIRDLRGPYKNRWAVMTVSPEKGGAAVTVTGCLPASVDVGDCCRFEGAWTSHEMYGDQFQASMIVVASPKDRQGQINYLVRRLSGVGPKLAKDLLERYGGLDPALQAIKDNAMDLIEIPGITADKAARMVEEVFAAESSQEFDLFCSTNNITPRLQQRLLDHYKTAGRVMSTIRHDPYVLADEIWGVGFRRADNIAAYLGVKKDSRKRLRAGVLYALSEAQAAGHCYLLASELVKMAADLLVIDEQLIVSAIADLVEVQRLVEEDGRYYRPELHAAEAIVAERLTQLLASEEPGWKRMPPELPKDVDLSKLDADQLRAVELAWSEKLLIITGGPGVGKTFTLKKILECHAGLRIELAAPTGKAAKRMIEATSRPARTIHRLLEYNFGLGGFTRDKYNPLDCDMVVIDEISMCDIQLMACLLAAIPKRRCQLIMVGDKDQLPSVGPGKVLADMIASGAIPVVELTQLHRQAAASLINVNAQRVNAGKPLLKEIPGAEQDFWVIPEENAAVIPERIAAICQRIPNQFKYPVSKIQVLCPQRVGPIGTKALNPILRDEVFNPTGPKIKGTHFRTGDRVIQLVNNYKAGVFNGDMGQVITVESGKNETLVVQFEAVEGTGTRHFYVEYPINALDELQLAYALTVHKSQGSEYPVVVMPVHSTNYIMLQRTLLYTGITRAKKLVVLIGNEKGINRAIKNAETKARNTALEAKLRSKSRNEKDLT